MRAWVSILFLTLFSATIFADELRTLTNRGISALRRGDPQTALEHFSAAAQNNPESGEAKFNMALAHTYLGNAKEAESILSQIKFEGDEQNIATLNLRAKIAETVGDFLAKNEQQPDFAQARKAYESARTHYADALDINRRRKNNARTREKNNYLRARIENLSHKIRELPEDEQSENDENQEQNQDQNQDGEQNQDQNEQKNEDGEQDKNEQNEREQEQNKDEQDRQDERNEQSERERQEQEERIEDALRLIELHADDASELNRPPLQKAQPAPGGKEW